MFITVKIMILKRYRDRPVTVFGPPLLTVTVFWPTLQTVTGRYHTVTIPFGIVPHRSGPSLTVRERLLPFGNVCYRYSAVRSFFKDFFLMYS